MSELPPELPEDQQNQPPPLHQPPPLQPITPINYSNLHAATPKSLQVLAGVATWILALSALLGSGYESNKFMENPMPVVVFVGIVMLSGIIILSAWLSRTYRWTGFVPGIFIGVLLSCLVPAGIALVICGSSGFNMH